MTGSDCRKRAEEARQQAALVNHRDQEIWLQIADKYDRLASELDWLDTRALRKERPPQLPASKNAEQIS